MALEDLFALLRSAFCKMQEQVSLPPAASLHMLLVSSGGILGFVMPLKNSKLGLIIKSMKIRGDSRFLSRD